MATTKTMLEGKKLLAAKKQAEPFMGVYVTKGNPNKPFRARLGTQHIGYFDNALDAAMAYNKMAKTTYGNVKAARAANRWNDVVTNK